MQLKHNVRSETVANDSEVNSGVIPEWYGRTDRLWHKPVNHQSRGYIRDTKYFLLLF